MMNRLIALAVVSMLALTAACKTPNWKPGAGFAPPPPPHPKVLSPTQVDVPELPPR